MAELFNKIKNIKGLWIIALLFVGAIVLLLFSDSIFSPKNTENTASTLNASELDSYAKTLETRIIELITPINGVDNVKVMVYLESTEEYIYDSSSKDANLTKVVSPRVCGVAVVCSGGNDATVKAKIIGIITALFGISSNHVYVSGG